MYSEANEDNENDWGVVNDDNSSYLPPRCQLYPFCDKAYIFGGKFACFEDGDKFGYSTTKPLRATATKLGSCDKHPVYCQKLGSLFSYVL